jgi:hypothetical protein
MTVFFGTLAAKCSFTLVNYAFCDLVSLEIDHSDHDTRLCRQTPYRFSLQGRGDNCKLTSKAMARIKQNLIMQGMSGAIGKQVIVKHYGSVSIISSYPDMSRIKRTTKQKTENNKFREASVYARGQMRDPIAKAAYKAKAVGMQTAYNVAMADYYYAPEIRNIDIATFHGNIGDKIVIHAVDDFRVVRVMVEVRDHEGTILETGDAEQTDEWMSSLQKLTFPNCFSSGGIFWTI